MSPRGGREHFGNILHACVWADPLAEQLLRNTMNILAGLGMWQQVGGDPLDICSGVCGLEPLQRWPGTCGPGTSRGDAV